MSTKKTTKTKAISFLLSLTLSIGLIPTKVFALSKGVSESTLLTGVYPASVAKMVSIPNVKKELLVFTEDMRLKGTSSLHYSLRDSNGRFSIPIIIENDNTWDMEPFILNDSHNTVVAWTDATRNFSESSSGEDMASSMRISISAFDTTELKFKDTISNAGSYDSDNISTYNPIVTKIDDKILVSWVVCKNISSNNKTYGIEGLYYNSQTNSFYAEKDAKYPNGQPIPMTFAKDSGYISTYSISKIGDKIIALYDENVDSSINISDVMYDAVITQKYLTTPRQYNHRRVKLSLNDGENVTTLTDGSSFASIIPSDTKNSYYYNNNKIYTINDTCNSVEFADVSKTGDTEYSIISKKGIPNLIAALDYEPLEGDGSITYYGKEYTKVGNQWVDKDGNAKDLKQEKISLYLIKDQKGTLIKLTNYILKETKFFSSLPSFYINSENQFGSVFVKKNNPSNINNRILIYSQCDYEYLMKSNYDAVDAEIEKANKLNPDNYKDFSAVTAAIKAVIRDKDIMEQHIVTGYATAIEKAIDDLEYKKANYDAVDAAIAKANKLNPDDYKDFSAVTAAIKAVIRDKDIIEQDIVTGYATAIGKAIDALELKPVTPPVTKPEIVEGSNQIVEQGKEAKFRSNADLKDFQKVLIDGKELSSDNYILKEGSTIVILKAEYVKTLEEGKHILSIVSTTGSGDTEFTVTKPVPSNSAETNSSTANSHQGNSPETGDNSNIFLWMVLILISAGGILTISLKNKKSVE